jgi:uncharacterized membrane protein
MSTRTRPKPGDPALRAYVEQRAHDFEDRVADAITAFAGSMRFVYIHIIWFSAWLILGIEDYPYGLLTMIVSLESVFWSTFVLISQNRSDEKSQVLADDQWRTVQDQQEENHQLIQTASRILELTTDIHASTTRSRQPADT